MYTHILMSILLLLVLIMHTSLSLSLCLFFSFWLSYHIFYMCVCLLVACGWSSVQLVFFFFFLLLFHTRCIIRYLFTTSQKCHTYTNKTNTREIKMNKFITIQLLYSFISFISKNFFQFKFSINFHRHFSTCICCECF